MDQKQAMITLEVLRELCPQSKISTLEKYVDPLNTTIDEFGIKKVEWFLAQIAHESGGFFYVRELASGAAYDTRQDLGNTRPEAVSIAEQHGTTAGRFYRGRGLVQITGYDNLAACGVALGFDLTHQPELLEQPMPATRSAGWFWSTHHCDACPDFEAVTRRINGGTNGLADRYAYLGRARDALDDPDSTVPGIA